MAVPTAAALLVLAAIVGAVLQVSTNQTDRLALLGQHHRVEVAIDSGLKAVAVNQEASTYWDDAALEIRRRPLDLNWIDDNLGVWLHTYYNIDEVYLLGPDDAPVYAMRDGRRVAPTAFARVAGPALDLARALRRHRSVYADQEGPGKTAGEARLAMIGGRPALVSVKPIVAEREALMPPGNTALHVAVRFVDGNFLNRMADQYVIEHPRFERTAGGLSSVALRDPAGTTIGFIAWDPFEPGRTVRNRMVPVLLAAFALIGLLIGGLLLRILRSRRDLEHSHAFAEHQAFHDSLTGLPNRTLFDRRLHPAEGRRDAEVAVLLLDLDRFKNVNDSLGHQAGDQLIRAFAARLTALVRTGDTIARLGGDEFGILIEGSSLTEAEGLAERILGEMRHPFDIDGVQIHVGVSIGLAISSDRPDDRAELVRKADIALYKAKEDGRNTCRRFHPDLDRRVKSRIRIERELRDALASDDALSLHYQPLVDGAGTIVGLEALLRWNHSTRGPIAPDQFIGIAEETGLIVPLGERVLEAAFAASRRWPDVFIAVNLSPIQFRSPEFVAAFNRILDSSGADPRKIQLEVTERVLLDDDTIVRAILAQLRTAGFKIVLDDFGKGYSSLSYLRTLEVDKIKIDGSFVQHLETAADARAIVTAVLALGHAVGLEVAAEGVETVAQRDFLKISGCLQMQGYLFSPAVPEAAVDALLARKSPLSAAA
ncbi:MAG: EAL domain-containing protein [Sphingomicrobium sp.]